MDARRGALLLAAAALVACDAPTVPFESPGYDPRLQGVDVIYHWPLGRTIAIYAHSIGAPPGFDLPTAIQQANDVWADVLRYREFDVRMVSSPSEADVVFHFDADSVVSSAACMAPGGSAPGVTYFCVDQTFENILALPLLSGQPSRVKFDVRITSNPGSLPNVTAFRRIVAHELGHVIGIGSHSGDNVDLMFSAPTVDAPSTADAQTIRWVLHQPAELRP
jgi:predicted Zn-dependent protease